MEVALRFKGSIVSVEGLREEAYYAKERLYVLIIFTKQYRARAQILANRDSGFRNQK